MIHQFRPRKSSESGGNGNARRRGRGGGGNREGLPKSEPQVDLDLLPEKDYNFFDTLPPAGLLKEAKAAKLDPRTLLRHEVIERLLPFVNAEKEAVYAKGILEVIQDYGFLRRETHLRQRLLHLVVRKLHVTQIRFQQSPSCG